MDEHFNLKHYKRGAEKVKIYLTLKRYLYSARKKYIKQARENCKIFIIESFRAKSRNLAQRHSKRSDESILSFPRKRESALIYLIPDPAGSGLASLEQSK